MLMRKLLVMAGLAALASSVFADASPIAAQTSVEPGVWCGDYTAARAYAVSNDVPMLVFWANPSCHYCELMETACQQQDFKVWQAARKLVMVFSYGDAEVKKIVKNDTAEFPYMMVYWARSASGETVEERFSGRAGRIPAPANPEDDLERQLMDAVDALTTGWDPDAQAVTGYTGGVFTVPDTAAARLEVLPTATSVLVPLVRTNGVSRADENVLSAGDWSTTVAWAKGESEKFVAVPLSDLAVGDTIALTLSHTNAVIATGAIHVVEEPENSPKNPKWLGEDFDFGEWTMDLDAAKAKTAAAEGEASTLVFFTGALWCPWCLALENNVLCTDEFKALMRENRVSLALIDETKRSPNDNTGAEPYAVTTVANGAAPTLLRYTVGANGNSGAAYLSRKGIGRDAAERVLLRNTLLGYPGGDLAAPEAVRTGYPTFILLDKRGAVKARFVYQADSSAGKDENGAYRADAAENLQRFRDFLALLADDTAVEGNKYYSTTALTHTLGDSAELKLHVCHNVQSYRLVGANAQHASFRQAYDSAGRGVTFTVVRAGSAPVARKDATGTTVDTVKIAAGTVIATGTGTLECDIPAVGDYYLRVSSFADALTAKYGSTGTTTQIVFTSEGTPLVTENAYVTKAFTTQAPLIEEGIAQGMITVTTTVRGRVTVRYTNALTGKTQAVSGNWTVPDRLGVATLTLYKRNVAVKLTLSADGALAATIDDATTGDSFTATASAAAIDYADYQGFYTVALPVVRTGDEEDQPYGTGSVTIRANTSSFLKTGKATCQVVFPNGTSTSGSVLFTAGTAGFANLTLYVKSGKDSLTIPMQVRPQAWDATTHRAICEQTDTDAIWVHSQKNYTFTRACGIYGSYYNTRESLLDCCGADDLLVDFEMSLTAASGRHGEIVAIAGQGSEIIVKPSSLARAAKVSKFSIATVRARGTVSGTARITFADGSGTTAKFRGVILPDWRDCGCFDEDPEVPLSVEIPFVYGTCYFSDMSGKTAVVRSIPFALIDKE